MILKTKKKQPEAPSFRFPVFFFVIKLHCGSRQQYSPTGFVTDIIKPSRAQEPSATRWKGVVIRSVPIR